MSEKQALDRASITIGVLVGAVTVGGIYLFHLGTKCPPTDNLAPAETEQGADDSPEPPAGDE